VVVSATFDHGDARHLINNMFHIACFAPALEARIGSTRLWIGFVVTGAGGWLTNLALLRWRHRGEQWEYNAKYQSSTGSSPATYGLTALLATFCPDACTCEIVVGGRVLPPWLLLALLMVFLDVARHVPAYNIQWWRTDGSPGHRPRLNPRCAVFLGVSISLVWLLATPLRRGWLPAPLDTAACGARGAPPAWLFACIYLAKTAVCGPLLKAALSPSGGATRDLAAYTLGLARAVVGPPFLLRPNSGADDAAHLGGSLCGVLGASMVSRVGVLHTVGLAQGGPLLAVLVVLVLRCRPSSEWGADE
jgi:membrane associated rhomboid family serine protease